MAFILLLNGLIFENDVPRWLAVGPYMELRATHDFEKKLSVTVENDFFVTNKTGENSIFGGKKGDIRSMSWNYTMNCDFCSNSAFLLEGIWVMSGQTAGVGSIDGNGVITADISYKLRSKYNTNHTLYIDGDDITNFRVVRNIKRIPQKHFWSYEWIRGTQYRLTNIPPGTRSRIGYHDGDAHRVDLWWPRKAMKIKGL